ncbi:MAG: hypothetical protein JWP93_2335 [Polaromonas sp.]|nr:hypothetical protein [Polaromonas sp.]
MNTTAQPTVAEITAEITALSKRGNDLTAAISTNEDVIRNLRAEIDAAEIDVLNLEKICSHLEQNVERIKALQTAQTGNPL